ncbi:MAG: hypothetical protein K5840_08490 [Eubacterium sp.]|nr:hypothetical protein [Eubacterium sp.]
MPIVLLIILLNSGFIQRHIPAGTCNGSGYTTTRYNYYFFTYYNDFIEENEDRLDELGYDSTVSDGEQYVDDEETVTYRDYFLAGGEELLCSTQYYLDLAEAAGYEFSDEELTAYDDKLADNEELMTTYGLTESSFYVAYYGVGMTADIYKAELLKQVKAEAYRDYLLKNTEVSDEEIEEYLAENDVGNYDSVNLSVITMSALPDRETDEIDAESLSALQSKLDALEARYEGGATFEELQAAFSDLALGDGNGSVTGAVDLDLPDVLSAWCVDGQESGDTLVSGDTCAVVDEETGIAYFAVFDSYGENAGTRTATLAVQESKVSAAETEALESDYQYTRNAAGMTLAAK